MAVFVWSSSYDLGIESIDIQHRALFDLLSNLHAALEENANDLIKLRILENLIHTCEVHFEYEYKIFIDNKYPYSKDHLKKHELLNKQAVELLRNCSIGKIKIKRKEVEFMRDWLLKHIVVDDQKYAPFMISKGVT